MFQNVIHDSSITKIKVYNISMKHFFYPSVYGITFVYVSLIIRISFEYRVNEYVNGTVSGIPMHNLPFSIIYTLSRHVSLSVYKTYCNQHNMFSLLNCVFVCLYLAKMSWICPIHHMASVMRKGTFGHLQKVQTQTSRCVSDAASDQGLHFLTLVT